MNEPEQRTLAPLVQDERSAPSPIEPPPWVFTPAPSGAPPAWQFEPPAGREVLRFLAACVIGAGIGLSGFPPLNNIAGVLHPQQTPVLVFLTAPMLLAFASLLAAWLAPNPNRAPIPRLAVAAAGALIIGAALSLLQSDRPDASLTMALDDIVAPALVFVGLRRSRLSLEVVAGAFLAALTVALLRADLVFFEQHGLPSLNTLYHAKFRSVPYDFHYYTLGNPNKTAAFLLMPLSLSLFWSMSNRLTPRSRGALLFAAGVCLLTLLLTYTRFILLVALVVLVVAIVVAPWSRWYRRIGLTALGAVLIAVLSSRQGSYLRHVFSTSGNSSGGIRLHSISAGIRAIIHHPLTGYGVGQYGVGRGTITAHSSIVEAGAEMGIIGLIGLLLLVLAFCLLCRSTLRRDGPRGFAAGAAIAGAAYQFPILFSGNVDFGLVDGFVAIYGLTLALVSTVALRGGAEPVVVPLPLRRRGQALAAATRAAASSARARYRGLSEPLQWGLPLVAYGVVFSAIVTAVLAGSIPARTLLPSRAQEVRDALATIHAGGPPLLGMAAHGYYAVNGAGRGIALYLPVIGQIFGQSNPNTLMAWLFLAAFAFTLAIYPLVFAELFGSRLLGLVAPLLLAWRFAFIHYSDTYWVYAWALATALPLLLLARRWWGTRRGTGLLIATMLLASFANSVRAFSGLPILLAGLAVIALTVGSRPKRLLVLGVCVLAYLSVTPAAFKLVDVIRNQAINGSATYRDHLVADPSGSGDALWQAAYTGLAFRENRHGIERFNSSPAISYVRSVKPEALYRSSAYNAALRSRFFGLLSSAPGFVVGTELDKALVVADDGLRSDWPVLLLLPLLLVWGRWRLAWQDLVIVAPAAAVVFLGAVLSWPGETRLGGYEFGWLGAAQLIWILVVLRALATAWSAVAGRELDFRSLPRSVSFHGLELGRLTPIRVRDAVRTWIAADRRRVRIGAGGIAAGLAVLVAFNIASAGGHAERFYEAGATYAPPPASLPVLQSWSFGQGIPAAFGSVGARRQVADGGVEITTSSGDGAPGLQLPVLYLPPGRYEIVVHGTINHGGMSLALGPAGGGRAVARGLFWDRQSQTGTLSIGVTLRSSAALRLTMANWSDGDVSSSWTIRDVELRGAELPAIVSWGFDGGRPDGWQALPRTGAAPGPSGLAFTTSAAGTTYQLISPSFELNPGSYELITNGLVTSGGIDLGVQAARTGAWIGQATDVASKGVIPMPIVRFSVSAPERAKVVLANWTHPARSSRWLIQQVTVRAVTAPLSGG